MWESEKHQLDKKRIRYCAGLKDGGQSAGRITLLATEKPTVNIPITIIVRNDL